MPKKESFLKHSVARIEEVLSIKHQITELRSRLIALFTGKPAKASSGKRGLAVRKKMAAAQKARWALKASDARKSVTKQAPKKGKRTLSPEVRAKLSAAAKARWAARKKS